MASAIFIGLFVSDCQATNKTVPLHSYLISNIILCFDCFVGHSSAYKSEPNAETAGHDEVYRQHQFLSGGIVW